MCQHFTTIYYDQRHTQNQLSSNKIPHPKEIMDDLCFIVLYPYCKKWLKMINFIHFILFLLVTFWILACCECGLKQFCLVIGNCILSYQPKCLHNYSLMPSPCSWAKKYLTFKMCHKDIMRFAAIKHLQ